MRNVVSLRIAALLVVALSLLVAAAWGDWPQLLGPNRDGVSTETRLVHSFPAGGPPVLWSVPLGVGFGGAAISKSEVFVMDRAGDTQDILICLNFATGKEKWRCAYDAPGELRQQPGTRCVPTVTNRYVFTTSPVGHLACIDRTTHKPVWGRDLVADFQARTTAWGYAQCPLLYKDWVIVAPQGPEYGVVAMAQATGKVVWHTPLQGSPGYVSPRLTRLGGVDQVVMLTAGGKRNGGAVTGLDAATGKSLWVYTGWGCGIPIPAPTVLSDDRLFVTGGYGAGSVMLKIAKQGEQWAATELWTSRDCASQIHVAIVYKDHLYANSFDNGQHDGLICMDLDGHRLWKSLPPVSFERGPIMLADRMLIALSGDKGELCLIDPQPDGYKELARAKVLSGQAIWGPMALTDGRLIVRSQSELKCLDLRAK